MHVAIATLRTPKIEGVKEALGSCPYFVDTASELRYTSHDTPSGISPMPLSQEEVMRGARNRARALKEAGVTADLYVGIEGGATRIEGRAYLFGCVYIEDASGTGHFGFSPSIEIPHTIEHVLYEEGKELGPVMSTLNEGKDVRSENGSMGEWTDDMFTRKDEFVTATRAAIAPFYNRYYTIRNELPGVHVSN
ncbi:MAG: DUF84 family protein [Candidatus Pacebacteria bacterium]|nr:DUF84 family protein [Candidatus Paceibacterota bacterium]